MRSALRRRGCSAPRSWGNGPGDRYGLARPRRPKVLFCLDGSIVFHTDDGDVELDGRRSTRPAARHAARGDRRTGRVRVRGSMGPMRVAFHTTSSGSPRPAGSAPTCASCSPHWRLPLTPRSCRLPVRRGDRRDADASYPARSGRCIRAGPGRPAGLPAALASCDVVHATNPAAMPPVATGQALVVTVHDLAFDVFPDAFPARGDGCTGPGSVARRDAQTSSSRRRVRRRRRGAAPRDRSGARVRHAAGRIAPHDAPIPATLAATASRPVRPVPGTLEPRKNLVRLVRAYRQVAPDVPHALVLAGPMGW